MEFFQKKFNKNILLGLPFNILILLALIFPRAYYEIKTPFLIIALAISLLKMQYETKVDIAKIFIIPIIYSLIAGYSAIVGIYKGNDLEAIYDHFRLNIIYPFIITIFWFGANKIKSFNFNKMVIFSVYIIFILISLLIISDFFQINIFSEQFRKDHLFNIGIHSGYIQITAHCIGSMLFISGYLLYNTILKKCSLKDYIHLFFAISIVILSSRRAIQLLVLLFPLISLFTCILLRIKYPIIKIIKKYIVFIFLLLTALFIFLNLNNISTNDIINRFLYILEDDDGVRTEQSIALLNGVMQNIFFGSGAGGLVEIIRSEEKPWLYELTYMQLLFNNGFIGMFFIITFFISNMIIIINNKYIQYTDKNFSAKFTGVLFLLLGSISNPYLGSFDFMLFIGTILIINPSKINYSKILKY
jgi:hypothetical protein